MDKSLKILSEESTLGYSLHILKQPLHIAVFEFEKSQISTIDFKNPREIFGRDKVMLSTSVPSVGGVWIFSGITHSRKNPHSQICITGY